MVPKWSSELKLAGWRNATRERCHLHLGCAHAESGAGRDGPHLSLGLDLESAIDITRLGLVRENDTGARRTVWRASNAGPSLHPVCCARSLQAQRTIRGSRSLKTQCFRGCGGKNAPRGPGPGLYPENPIPLP